MWNPDPLNTASITSALVVKHTQNLNLVENKWNGNRTFVGLDCVTNVDPKAAGVIGYFKYILENTV